ncbi:MAG: hypothetical protein JWR26_806 [Pedosphaera sp.]|nr:hypothetical protein [Pedosphaera sp.]
MNAKLILFNGKGERVAHRLSLHHRTSDTTELKLVMETSTERFEEWMFFFLRDHGAYIETTDPAAVAAALNLPPGEEGIVKVAD